LQILSYGEDPLTYWALTLKLQKVLELLSDSSIEDEVLLIYRPSFGRRASSKKGKRHSVFGEFDSILATPVSIYLIESKWEGSSEIKDGIVKLRSEQRFRHMVLRWYIEKWREAKSPNWQDFINKFKQNFESKFDNLTIPGPGTKLAQNLELVLNHLQSFGQNIVDVLLYIGRKNTEPKSVDPKIFKLICLEYAPLNKPGYFWLNRH